MTQTATELITLTPSEGMHLRNKRSGLIAEGNVYLGKNDSVDNYEDVTHETYLAYLEEQERLATQPDEAL